MRSAPRNQSGFMLPAVLVTLAFLTLVSSALLAMTIAVRNATEQHELSASRVRAADGALEVVINQLRIDRAAAGTSCPDSSTHDGYATSYLVSTPLGGGSTSDVVVECATTVSSSPPRRVVTLTARPKPALAVVGMARVRIDDSSAGAPRPGSTLIVCDWQLGAAISSTLADCPS